MFAFEDIVVIGQLANAIVCDYRTQIDLLLKGVGFALVLDLHPHRWHGIAGQRNIAELVLAAQVDRDLFELRGDAAEVVCGIVQAIGRGGNVLQNFSLRRISGADTVNLYQLFACQAFDVCRLLFTAGIKAVRKEDQQPDVVRIIFCREKIEPGDHRVPDAS